MWRLVSTVWTLKLSQRSDTLTKAYPVDHHTENARLRNMLTNYSLKLSSSNRDWSRNSRLTTHIRLETVLGSRFIRWWHSSQCLKAKLHSLTAIKLICAVEPQVRRHSATRAGSTLNLKWQRIASIRLKATWDQARLSSMGQQAQQQTDSMSAHARPKSASSELTNATMSW